MSFSHYPPRGTSNRNWSDRMISLFAPRRVKRVLSRCLSNNRHEPCIVIITLNYDADSGESYWLKMRPSVTRA